MSYRTSRTIASQFPVRFPDGGTWEIFQGQCKICDAIIADESLIGEVTSNRDGFMIAAVGHCDNCRQDTHFSYQLTPDMGMEGRHPETHKWARWEPLRSRKPWWRLVQGWIW